MPAQLAAFPKCFLDEMIAGEMSVFQWIEMAATLPHVSGLEMYAYPRALESWETDYLHRVRDAAAAHNLPIPMLCASPDFTQPDVEARAAAVEQHARVINVAAELGAQYCRVLSGQKRPDVAREDGVNWTVQSIEALLPHAKRRGVTLILENHYKDPLWKYPEFAQREDVFREIVGRIDDPNFGVNYDPSNAVIAGDDPYDLLDAVKERVVTMHASDRKLEGGSLEDLQKIDADPLDGYASFVKHGVVGEGLIDYDRIFRTLKSVDFDGWISIEDGQDASVGMEHLEKSAEFLWRKMKEHDLAR